MTATDPSTVPDTASLLTIDDVRAAAGRIAGAVVNTAMDYSRTLSQITGADIWLKFENLQFTAAYKERGALNAMLLLGGEQANRGVIAASIRSGSMLGPPGVGSTGTTLAPTAVTASQVAI